MTVHLDNLKKAVLRLLHAHAPQDEQVDPLLVVSLGRVLFNAAKRGEDFRTLATGTQIRHIYDWLKAEVLSGAAWLSIVDEKGRPRKLLKFGSVAQIVKEADKAMEKANQRTGKVSLVEGEEVVIAELENGYTLVRMLTPAALDRESKAMQHCIGHGSYDANLNNSQLLYLSLRDSFGKPHVTMEISDYGSNLHIYQLSGKQNDVPRGKYLALLRPWFKANDVWFPGLSPAGIIISVEDEIYHPEELPDGFKTKGDFQTRHLADGRIPENMVVNGDMYANRNENLQTFLPKGLRVKGDLLLSWPESISDNTVVAGTLDASVSMLKQIGENCKIGRNCKLNESKVSKLPKKMMVGGILDIASTDIEIIPDGVTFAGLHAEESKLNALPEHIKEYDELHIMKTAISKIPEGLKVGALVGTKLNLTSCPKNLEVEYQLYILNSNISLINGTWKMPNSTGFEGSTIGEMRGDLVFSSPLYDIVEFTNTKIGKLPDSITCENGGLSFVGSDISTLPKMLNVQGELDLRETPNLRELPADCDVRCKTLVLNYNPPMELPESWQVETVTLTDGSEYETNMSAAEYRKNIRNELATLEAALKF